MFLNEIMKHPRVIFAFNSSIMRKNMIPIITKMFEVKNDLSNTKDLLHYLPFLFDQEYSKDASV